MIMRTASLACAAAIALFGCRQSSSTEQVYTGAKQPVPPSTPRDASIIDFDAGVIETPFTKQGLLSELAACTHDRIRDFESLAAELSRRADTFASARSEENRTAARTAWREAIATWEELEMMQIGPAGKLSAPGGRGFRDQIYAFPLFSRCKVEEQLVAQTYQQETFSTSLINARGLAAFEYLLFYEGTDNACSQFSRINADGTWAAIGADELAQRKADYAAAVARIIAAAARGLLDAWEPAGGNFRATLETAGNGSALFASDQDALNAISDGLFYLDKELKDLKLGRPLGFSECFNTLCPEALESQYARVSTELAKHNLIGYRRFVVGCAETGEGLGFDDWLRAAGAGDLADRTVVTALEAIAAVEALDPPLEVSLLTETDKVRGVYDAIKAANDLLKTELVTVLNLELPMVVEGDND